MKNNKTFNLFWTRFNSQKYLIYHDLEKANKWEQFMLNFPNNIWGEFKRAEFVYFVNNCGHVGLDVYIIVTEYVYLLLIRANN